MKTSELLRATRKRFDARVAELLERNVRLKKIPGAELDSIDVGSQLENALYDAAGGMRGALDVLEAERVLERITSPQWCELAVLFDKFGPDSTPAQWAELRAAGLRAQREPSFKEWLEAPGRQADDVRTLLTRAFARAVKDERENG